MTTRATPRGRLHGILLPFRRRGVMLVGAFLAADAAVAMAACSTSSPEVDGADATTESAPPDAAKEGSVVQPEASTDAGGGHCSPAKGACDLVLQDCPSGKECTVNASGTTECTKTDTSQQLPIGRACCPNGNGNPCLPGLTCIGSACVDGGPASGRCTPACCKGADQTCGKSDPEGISGACALTIVDPTSKAPLFDVCTYSQTCKPFKVQPCAAGDTCLTEDAVGTSSCVTSDGKTNRQPCSFANDCADGLICLGSGDAGSCHTVCLFPGSTHPFDASVEKGGPGMGGCPANEKCSFTITGLPSWYGACSLDGG